MEQYSSDIHSVMTMECGKPLKEAAVEVHAGLASLDWYAGEAIRCFPSHAPVTPLQPLKSDAFLQLDTQSIEASIATAPRSAALITSV